MKKSLETRRRFLRAAAALPAVLSGATVLGRAPALLGESPEKTIGVGCIGLGTRGGNLIEEVVEVPGVKVVAVCDVYGPHLEKGVEKSKNPEVRKYVDYGDLLADKAVDAVVIAAPDHWHSKMVLDAAGAKKDIYCEKGWTRTIAEAKLMLQAVKKSKVVHQLGHQARAITCGVQAGEVIRQGLLGPVTLVRTGRFGNTPRGRNIWRWYGYYDRWTRPDPAKVVKDVDWARWLGPAEKRPFDFERFWHWRCYWEYGTGQAGDLLSHELDFVQSVLGHGIPDTCVCAGLNAFLKDGREVPDTWNAVFHFEKHDRTVTFDASMNSALQQNPEFRGKDAALVFDGIAHNATTFAVTPEIACEHKEKLPAAFDPARTPPQPSHMQDFFDCVRSRGKPKCNEDEAFIETATFLMSVAAYKEKRQVRWDPVKQDIV
jgi:predicted dehydrogenase